MNVVPYVANAEVEGLSIDIAATYYSLEMDSTKLHSARFLVVRGNISVSYLSQAIIYISS